MKASGELRWRLLRAFGLALVLCAIGGGAQASIEGATPTISSVSPATIAPGGQITVQGDHFASDNAGCSLGTPTVILTPLKGGAAVNATPTSCSNQTLKVNLPASLGLGAGGVKVAVRDPDTPVSHTSNTGSSGFYPQVTFFPSLSTAALSGDVETTAVTVGGTNLRPPSATAVSVSVGGAAQAVSGWLDTAINFTPPRASGAISVTFTYSKDANNSANTITPASQAAGSYTFQAPAVSTTSLGSLHVGDGFTINGSHLGGSGAVTFPGNVAAGSVAWGSSRVTGTVPAGAQNGSLTLNASGYSLPGPSVAMLPLARALSPATASGGAPVTVSGYNFGATSGSLSVGGWRRRSRNGAISQ